MDPLRFAIAAVPLSAYLLTIGLLHLRGRPVVVTGAADLMALGIGLTGIAIVGPLELFRPAAATTQMGAGVWAALVTLYWLWLLLAAMLCRPRLVVYNRTPEELRPDLSEAARLLDPGGRWAGDALALRALGVQLHLDGGRSTQTTSLIASGPDQDPAGWRRLRRAIDRGLRKSDSVGDGAPGVGATLCGFAVGGLAITVWRLASDPAAVAEAARQLFGL